jgi:hypothetical protein
MRRPIGSEVSMPRQMKRKATISDREIFLALVRLQDESAGTLPVLETMIRVSAAYGIAVADVRRIVDAGIDAGWLNVVAGDGAEVNHGR